MFKIGVVLIALGATGIACAIISLLDTFGVIDIDNIDFGFNFDFDDDSLDDFLSELF